VEKPDLSLLFNSNGCKNPSPVLWLSHCGHQSGISDFDSFEQGADFPVHTVCPVAPQQRDTSNMSIDYCDVTSLHIWYTCLRSLISYCANKAWSYRLQ